MNYLRRLWNWAGFGKGGRDYFIGYCWGVAVGNFTTGHWGHGLAWTFIGIMICWKWPDKQPTEIRVQMHMTDEQRADFMERWRKMQHDGEIQEL